MFLLRLREDNRGLSLVEIIISMALLTIIMGCLILMMSSAGKGYTRGSIQAKLQEDAQDAANYLTDSILASNNVTTDFGGTIEYVILRNFDKEDVKDGTADPALSPYKAFVKIGKEMYFYSVDSSASETVLNNVLGGAAPSKYNLLCKNVDVFAANYTEKSSKQPKDVVDYTITLKVDNPKTEFTLSNSVALRNKPEALGTASPAGISSPGAI